MQNDNLTRGLFNAAPFLLIFLLIIAAFVCFIGYVLYQTRQRRKVQQNLAEQARQNAGAGNAEAFAVKYATGKNFYSWLKVFPWEASGVFLLRDTDAQFLGSMTSSKRPLEIVFTAEQARVSWVGKTFINGVTSWFLIEQAGEKYYFTAETGATVIGTGDQSKKIMEAVGNHLNRLAQL